MSRINLLHKLDYLLKQCENCTRLDRAPEIKCAGCEWYTQIREIGNQLGRKKDMARGKLEMTVDEFIKLKYVKQLPITRIAELKEVSDPTIHYWMKKHNQEIEKALNKTDTAEKKPSVTKTIQEDKTAEYERLIQSLRNDLQSAHTQIDEKEELVQKLQKTIEKYQHVDAACEDIENEVVSLREEKTKLQSDYNQLVTAQYHKDYQIENQKKRIEDLGDTLALYEKENKAMRALLQLWI